MRLIGRRNLIRWMAVAMLAIGTTLITACTTTEQLVMQDLYSVSIKTVAHIEGDFVVERFLLYKRTDFGLGVNEILTVDRFSFDDGRLRLHAIAVQYTGGHWRFMDTVRIRTDAGLFTLQDDQPTREVQSGGWVEEIIGVVISDDLYETLVETSELHFQFYREPIEIPADGIEALKRFLVE